MYSETTEESPIGEGIFLYTESHENDLSNISDFLIKFQSNQCDEQNYPDKEGKEKKKEIKNENKDIKENSSHFGDIRPENFDKNFEKEEKCNILQYSKHDQCDNEKNEEKDENEVQYEKYEDGENNLRKEIEKKELFIIQNEKNLKIGNNTKKKDNRYDNKMAMIIRNLIQEIFLDWINYGESDDAKKLCKINPEILRKNYDLRGKTLGEIYSKKLSEKEKQKYGKDHNIEIINNSSGIKKIKLNFKFEEALKLFLCINNANKNLSEIINLDEYKEEEILKGLKGKEEYINRKKGYKNLPDAFNRIEKKYLNN